MDGTNIVQAFSMIVMNKFKYLIC